MSFDDDLYEIKFNLNIDGSSLSGSFTSDPWDFDDIPVGRPKKTVTRGFDTNAVEIEIPSTRGGGTGKASQTPPPKYYMYPSFDCPEKKEKGYEFNFDHYYLKKITVPQNKIRLTLSSLFEKISRVKEKQTGYIKNDFRIAYTSYLPDRVIEYYVWWRNNYLRGNVLPADTNYVYILITELLIFSEDRSPESILADLERVWNDYPDVRYSLCESVIFFCLSHGVFVPDPFLSHKVNYIKNYSNGKRYSNPIYELLVSMKCGGLTEALILLNQAYDWKSSRCYNDKTKDLFDRLIPKAVSACLNRIIESGRCDSGVHEESIFYYNMITSGYGTYMTGDSIRVTVSNSLRELNLSDAVSRLEKYCENKIREICGIAGKLRPDIRGLEKETELIDKLFEPLIKKHNDEKLAARNAEPEYMKKYDSERGGLNISSALKIEDASWEVAEKMTSGIEEVSPVKEPEPAPETSQSEDDLIAKEGLESLTRGENLTAAAKKYNLMPDTVAEIINNRLFEIIGDACVEQGPDGEFRIIEDYKEDIAEYVRSV